MSGSVHNRRIKQKRRNIFGDKPCACGDKTCACGDKTFVYCVYCRRFI